METWKPVYGFEGWYEISNEGRVKRVMPSRGAKVGRILRQGIRKGYLTVQIQTHGSKKLITVHREIANAFIPNPNNLPEVNHINFIRTDNKIGNLEWITEDGNKQHAYKNGRFKCGEGHYNAKLKDDQIRQIRRLKGTLSQSKIGKMFNVCQTYVGDILRFEKRRDVV